MTYATFEYHTRVKKILLVMLFSVFYSGLLFSQSVVTLDSGPKGGFWTSGVVGIHGQTFTIPQNSNIVVVSFYSSGINAEATLDIYCGRSLNSADKIYTQSISSVKVGWNEMHLIHPPGVNIGEYTFALTGTRWLPMSWDNPYPGGVGIYNGTFFNNLDLYFRITICDSILNSEIDIKVGADALADGATYDFGDVCITNLKDVTFTIENNGTGCLTMIQAPIIKIEGADAGKFLVLSQPSSPIPSLGNDTFTIRFTPTIIGDKTASISIMNNDSDEDPYNITLAGTGLTNEPVLSNIELTDLTFTEGDGSKVITSTISVADADDTNIESAVVQITGNYQNGGDVLEFTNTANITGTLDLANGKMTLTGSDTKANYQTALRSVKYINSSDDPGTLVRTVSFTINDGDGNSNIVSRQITIVVVDDAAQLSDQNEPFFVTEGEEAKITNRHLSITDPDDPYLRYQLLTLPQSGTLRRYGTILSLENDFLQNDIDEGIITYTHGGGEASEDSFDYQVINSSQEILLSGTFIINIVTVNDPPAFIDVPASIPLVCGEQLSLNVWDYIDDPDTDPSTLTIECNCGNENVVVTYNSETGQMDVEILTNFSGTVIVCVTVTDQDGTTITTDIPIQLSMGITGIENELGVPTDFNLAQNFPNPFNPTTTIKYGLPIESNVVLRIYNMLGQQVLELVNKVESAGYHEVTFNASTLTSGIYFYKIEAGNFMEIKKMILIK